MKPYTEDPENKLVKPSTIVYSNVRSFAKEPERSLLVTLKMKPELQWRHQDISQTWNFC